MHHIDIKKDTNIHPKIINAKITISVCLSVNFLYHSTVYYYISTYDEYRMVLILEIIYLGTFYTWPSANPKLLLYYGNQTTDIHT